MSSTDQTNITDSGSHTNGPDNKNYLHGFRIMKVPWAKDHIALHEKIRGFKIRDDDILLASFPKCGSHWTWEIIHMLVHQTTTFESRHKDLGLLEYGDSETRLENEPSPRILCSHLVFAHLPQEIISKKIKIIHIVRNPKDALVSMFHFIKFYDTFQELIQHVKADDLAYQTQFTYLRQMKEYEKAHPDHPIKHIYYEDMIKNPVKIISELAKFLEVPASDTFCQQVADACSFDKMKKFDEEGNKEIPALNPEDMSRPELCKRFKLYRKGKVGDWKDTFTEEQNQEFDALIKSEEEKGLGFTFTYE